jgi:hypothetical protein
MPVLRSVDVVVSIAVSRVIHVLSDTTLIPPGTQYGATPGKQGKKNRLIYAGFAWLCKSLQHLIHHS